MFTSKLYTLLDARYTLRLLAKRPASTILSILVLAFGLGLSIFTFTTAITLAYKDIPLPEGGSIVRLCTGTSGDACGAFRAYEFSQIRSDISALDSIAVASGMIGNIESASIQVDLIVTETEWEMFSLAGVNAFMGRELREFDQTTESDPVIVLGYDSWQSIFGSDPDILDQRIKVNGSFRRIVGVMPEDYKFPANSQAWIPLKNQISKPLENSEIYVTVYARLKDGYTRNDASSELENLYKRIRLRYPLDPEEYGSQNFVQTMSANVSTLPMALVGGQVGVLALASMNLLSILVFLLVSINVGTLLLARINEQIKETAIRTALGGPVLRLLIQTMSENLFIVIAGVLLAILFAGLFLDLLNLFLLSTVAEEIPFWAHFEVDSSTLIAVLVFTVLTVFVTCITPGWRVVNGDFNSILRDGTRGAVGIKAGRVSKNIVTTAVSLITLLLYVGALAGSLALMYKDVYSIKAPPNLIKAEISLSANQYTDVEATQVLRSIGRQLDRTNTLDGSISFGSSGRLSIKPAEAVSTVENVSIALVQSVLGDFNVIEASLLEGRYFDTNETSVSQSVAIVSQTLAEKVWPSASPIGRELVILYSSTEVTRHRVIGMVSDTLISGRSILTPQSDAVYLPMSQSLHREVSIYAKYVGGKNEAFSTFREVILSNGVQYPIEVLDYEDEQEASIIAMNSGITLIIICGLFAFFVALMGIYGLSMNAVIMRTQEIGTKRALGATETRISREFILDGIKQIAFGVLMALIVSLPLSLLVFSSASAEYLAITIPMIIGVFLILFASLSVSVYYPVRWILRREPIEALRHQ